MPPAPIPQLEIVAVDTFPVREPVSRRTYTCLRVRTRSGETGWGEAARIAAEDLATLRAAVRGKEASSFESIRRGLKAGPGALAALDIAMLDLLGKFSSAPVYQILGGPTRNSARALARIAGDTDAAVASAVSQAHAAGHRAFLLPVPAVQAPNHSATLVNATRRRLDQVRSAIGDGCDFVLDGGGKLTPGDASTIAAALERLHLLWFDEPCSVSNLSAASRVSGENVTPVGFGRFAAEPGVFQDLLRSDAVDVFRPDLATYGISQSRRIAALAEPSYVAVAPFHDGGPIATAAALNLAASLPNFFIQQVPYPAAEEDRRMRARVTGVVIEAVKDGFLELTRGPGLGISVNEVALAEYREREA
jgi:galactonate dehydratase